MPEPGNRPCRGADEECDSVIAIERQRSPAREPVYLNSLMLNFVGMSNLEHNAELSRERFIRGARRRRRHRRRDSDGRAGADAHLLGDDVLPLRVPRDIDRAVRSQRERRLRLCHAPHVRSAVDRGAADHALAALRRRDRAGARSARAHSRGPELLPRKPREDDRDLHAGGSALLHRRRGHLAGHHAPQKSRECRVRRRPDRRGGRLSSAVAAAESVRRSGGGAAGGRARRRSRAAVLARLERSPAPPHSPLLRSAYRADCS